MEKEEDEQEEEEEVEEKEKNILPLVPLSSRLNAAMKQGADRGTGLISTGRGPSLLIFTRV